MRFLLTTCGTKAILTENIQELQTILYIINEIAKKYDLNINMSKTGNDSQLSILQ